MKKNIFVSLIISLISLVLSMGDMVGLASILVVIIVIILLAKRRPEAAVILYVALALRMLTIYIGNNFFTLPDSAGDAYWFEVQAYEWSKEGFPKVLDKYPGWAESFFISYIIAIFYSITDRSVMLAQSLSLLFGTISVLITFRVAQKIWDTPTAIKIGWFAALLPSMILYSALIMREVYVTFFLLIALNYVVDWTRTRSLKSFFLVILNFMIGTAWHGGIFVGLIIFLGYSFIPYIKYVFKKLLNGMIMLKSLIACLLIVTFINFFNSNDIFLPKIGYINDFKILKKSILKKNLVTYRGDAKYPEWIIAKSETELLYKIPLKAMYFIFSPFPWDVKKASHLTGMFDGFLHFFLVYLIFRNRKAIWADPALRIIFLILLTYLFVYGVGIGNFGTGIRHRAKFIVMFMLLAAPLLPKFIFNKKIKK
jgi:hypothetical protein